MDVEAGLTFGNAARASGLRAYTLRYYERAGLAFIDRKIAIYKERIYG
jgi:DNA-binding transcriptional MerR regulator